MKRARAEDGFTLIEMLVTMAIAAIVFGATLSVLEVFQSNNRFDLLRSETQDNARNAIDRLARQLRNVAAPGEVYFGALEQAEPYSIAFQTIDTAKIEGGENQTNAMRVRYCLDDSNPNNEILWEQVKRWKKFVPLPAMTSCPDRTNEGTAEADWTSTTQLVQHVTNKIGGQNRPLFIYSAVGVPQIVAVETDLFINLNPGKPRPGESELTTGVSLRNANRQPIASFTATPVNEHVILNASASQDPDGLALTYKWKEDSTMLPTTAQQYSTPLIAGSHTFELEVTSPGGLTACAQAAEVSSTSSSKESTKVSCPI
jgi:prepilin-type N-terminal cleavage/methylation domain-containing protein